jgi:L-fucose isomerase-like protein
VGQDVVVAYDVNNNMSATVVSYTSGTNTLVVNVNDVRGSGEYSSWSVNLDGATGVQGTTGAQGTQGVQGTEGTQGTQGTLGAQGTEGAQGTIGSQGTEGTQGTQGTLGTQGTEGAQGISGQLGTYAETITPASPYTATSFNIDHNLNSTDILVTVWEISSGAEVVTDVIKSNANRVAIAFAVAPVSGETYRVVVKA